MWYRFTATEHVFLEVDTAGSSYPTAVSAYQGSCGTLTEISCNAECREEDSQHGRMVVEVAQGETVLIQVMDQAPGLPGTVPQGGALHLRAAVPERDYPELPPPATVAESGEPNPLGGALAVFAAPGRQGARRITFAGATQALVARLDGVLTTIAATGTPAPGGGTFSSFGPPALNPSGTAAFYATLEDAPATAGIFRWSAGTAETVALEGGLAPTDGAVFGGLREAVGINAGGDIAFASATGLFRRAASDGSITQLVAANDPSPCGGTLGRIDVPGTLAMNDAAGVVFHAGGPSARALLRVQGGQLAKIACAGESTALGGTWRSFGDGPAIDGSGNVFFQGRIVDLPPPMRTRTGIFVWGGAGSPAAVAVEGDPTPSGETYLGFAANVVPATNSSGDLAFAARLERPSGETILGLIARPAGTTASTLVLATGEPCPTGGTFVDIGRRAAMDETGLVAFTAACPAGPGIFTWANGASVASVAGLTAQTAAGTGFVFDAASAGGGDVAFSGKRTAVLGRSCSPAGCESIATLVGPLDAVPDAPGQVVGDIEAASVATSGPTVAFIATSAGVAHQEAVYAMRRGTLQTVAAEGMPGPGGVFTALPRSLRPAVHGRSVAFLRVERRSRNGGR